MCAREHERGENRIAFVGVAGVVVCEARARQIVRQRTRDDFPQAVVFHPHRFGHTLLKAGERIAGEVVANATRVSTVSTCERNGNFAFIGCCVGLQRDRGFALHFRRRIGHSAHRQRRLQLLLNAQSITAWFSFFDGGKIPHGLLAVRWRFHVPRHYDAFAWADALFALGQCRAVHVGGHIRRHRALR